MRPGVRVAAGLIPVLLALAGCGSQAREVVVPTTERTAHPVVAVGQARSVLTAVESALVRGVGPEDTAETVDARLLGPARELALAEATVAGKRKREVAAPAEVDEVRLIVPKATGWPRFFVAAGASSESAAPVLRVLASTGPRSPYGLWAEPALLPGATLPETASADTGAVPVAADADGLVASPAEVVTGFAEYLNTKAGAAESKRFRRNVFSDQLQQRLAADAKGLKAVATVKSTHRPGSSAPLAVRTLDGGALVFAELTQKYEVTVKKGKGTVQVSDADLAALAGGKKQFSTKFTRTAVEVVVFHVPPRGKGLITVIAAQKGDVGAVAK